jgi:hypothetical protein
LWNATYDIGGDGQKDKEDYGYAYRQNASWWENIGFWISDLMLSTPLGMAVNEALNLGGVTIGNNFGFVQTVQKQSELQLNTQGASMSGAQKAGVVFQNFLDNDIFNFILMDLPKLAGMGLRAAIDHTYKPTTKEITDALINVGIGLGVTVLTLNPVMAKAAQGSAKVGTSIKNVFKAVSKTKGAGKATAAAGKATATAGSAAAAAAARTASKGTAAATKSTVSRITASVNKSIQSIKQQLTLITKKAGATRTGQAIAKTTKTIGKGVKETAKVIDDLATFIDPLGTAISKKADAAYEAYKAGKLARAAEKAASAGTAGRIGGNVADSAPLNIVETDFNPELMTQYDKAGNKNFTLNKNESNNSYDIKYSKKVLNEIGRSMLAAEKVFGKKNRFIISDVIFDNLKNQIKKLDNQSDFIVKPLKNDDLINLVKKNLIDSLDNSSPSNFLNILKKGGNDFDNNTIITPGSTDNKPTFIKDLFDSNMIDKTTHNNFVDYYFDTTKNLNLDEIKTFQKNIDSLLKKNEKY